MSEYWVSHKKYLCKYCNIYIADDAPSKRQHETGLRHKGNVERFVRGLYKAGEKRKQDLEEEKREMARIEKVAGAAFAQDVGAGLAKAGSSSTAGPSSAASSGSKQVAAPKPSNPFANYSTAESLGFTDPDAERAKAEAERRRTQGVAGEWEVVAVVPQENGVDGLKDEEEGKGQSLLGAGDAQVGEKRPADAIVDEEDGRGWKLRRKTASVGLGDLYDPGALPIKLKAKKEGATQEVQTAGSYASTGVASGASEKPKWSARGWDKPGASSSSAEKTGSADAGQVYAEEEAQADGSIERLVEDAPPVLEESLANVKSEEVKPEPVESVAFPPPAGGSLFKKRKVPVGGGNRGGRRI